MQTLLMTMVLLSLAGALFKLNIINEKRMEKWNWIELDLLIMLFLLNHFL